MPLRVDKEAPEEAEDAPRGLADKADETRVGDTTVPATATQGTGNRSCHAGQAALRGVYLLIYEGHPGLGDAVVETSENSPGTTSCTTTDQASIVSGSSSEDLHTPRSLMSVSTNTTDSLPSDSAILHNSLGPFQVNLICDLANLPSAPKGQGKSVPPGIFSNMYFTVGHSKLGGYGSLSTRYIPEGTNILVERALLVATDDGLVKARLLLDEKLSGIFDTLSRHVQYGLEPGSREGVWKQIFDTNKYGLCSCTRAIVLSADMAQKHRFLVGVRRNGDIVSGVFPVAARFNHKCRGASNIDFRANHLPGQSYIIVLTASRDIAEGEELTISYTDKEDASRFLYGQYGIRCRCGACDTISEEEVHEIDNCLW
jgi:hypothetical protein